MSYSSRSHLSAESAPLARAVKKEQASDGDRAMHRANWPIAIGALLVAFVRSGLCPALPLPEQPPKVTEVPQALRERYNLDPFYEKCTDYKGYPILSSA